MAERKNSITYWRGKAKEEIHRFTRRSASVDITNANNSNNNSPAVAIRQSPPLSYHHLHQDYSNLSTFENSLPYQIPQVLPSDAFASPASQTQATKRPLPVPVHSVETRFAASAELVSTPPTMNKPQTFLPAPEPQQMFTPSPSSGARRRPLPQPRPDQISRAQSIASSMVSFSNTPSLYSQYYQHPFNPTHGRSASSSDPASAVSASGLNYLPSSSSFNSAFSSSSLANIPPIVPDAIVLRKIAAIEHTYGTQPSSAPAHAITFMSPVQSTQAHSEVVTSQEEWPVMEVKKPEVVSPEQEKEEKDNKQHRPSQTSMTTSGATTAVDPPPLYNVRSSSSPSPLKNASTTSLSNAHSSTYQATITTAHPNIERTAAPTLPPLNFDARLSPLDLGFNFSVMDIQNSEWFGAKAGQGTSGNSTAMAVSSGQPELERKTALTHRAVLPERQWRPTVETGKTAPGPYRVPETIEQSQPPSRSRSETSTPSAPSITPHAQYPVPPPHQQSSQQAPLQNALSRPPRPPRSLSRSPSHQSTLSQPTSALPSQSSAISTPALVTPSSGHPDNAGPVHNGESQADVKLAQPQKKEKPVLAVRTWDLDTRTKPKGDKVDAASMQIILSGIHAGIPHSNQKGRQAREKPKQSSSLPETRPPARQQALLTVPDHGSQRAGSPAVVPRPPRASRPSETQTHSRRSFLPDCEDEGSSAKKSYDSVGVRVSLFENHEARQSIAVESAIPSDRQLRATPVPVSSVQQQRGREPTMETSRADETKSFGISSHMKRIKFGKRRSRSVTDWVGFGRMMGQNGSKTSVASADIFQDSRHRHVHFENRGARPTFRDFAASASSSLTNLGASLIPNALHRTQTPQPAHLQRESLYNALRQGEMQYLGRQPESARGTGDMRSESRLGREKEREMNFNPAPKPPKMESVARPIGALWTRFRSGSFSMKKTNAQALQPTQSEGRPFDLL